MAIKTKHGFLDYGNMVQIVPLKWRGEIIKQIKKYNDDVQAINLITLWIKRYSFVILIEKGDKEYTKYINNYNNIIESIEKDLMKIFNAGYYPGIFSSISKINKINSYLYNFKNGALNKEGILQNHMILALDQAVNRNYPIEDIQWQYPINEKLKADMVVFLENEIIVMGLKKESLEKESLYQLYNYGCLLKKKYPDKKINKILICYKNNKNMDKLSKELEISIYTYEIKEIVPLWIDFNYCVGNKNPIMEYINECSSVPEEDCQTFVFDYVTNKTNYNEALKNK